MAGSVNKVILIGNLGKDPEVKYFESGSLVAKFSIATSETYKDKSGNRMEQTEWHNIEVWDNLAKVAEQYLKKGNSVYIEGKIKTDSWEDAGVKKYATKIRATAMTLLGGKPSEQSEHSNSSASNSAIPASIAAVGDESDDLPF